MVDDQASLYLQDMRPASEGRYRAAFRFDPNGFDTGVAQSRHRVIVFGAFTESPLRRRFVLILRYRDGAYALRGRVRRDDGTRVDTPFIPLSDEPHDIQVDWQRATGPGANDGRFELWIDGVSTAVLTGIEVYDGLIDFARLGALSVKPGATGTLRWDGFDSRRGTFIAR
jgi:hypothetical protein